MATKRLTFRWFSISKGYGFMVDPAKPEVDYYVHQKTLKEAGVYQFGSGFEADCITDVTGDLCRVEKIKRVVFAGEPVGGKVLVCKWYNRISGYGFMTDPSNENEDIFIHAEALEAGKVVNFGPGVIADCHVLNARRGKTVGHVIKVMGNENAKV